MAEATTLSGCCCGWRRDRCGTVRVIENVPILFVEEVYGPADELLPCEEVVETPLGKDGS